MRSSQQGFTLIELMISLTIGLMIVALVGIIYSNNSYAFRFQTAQTEVNDSGRYLMRYLQQHVTMAGFHRDSAILPDMANYTKEAPLRLNNAAKDTELIYRYQLTDDNSSTYLDNKPLESIDCTGKAIATGSLGTVEGLKYHETTIFYDPNGRTIECKAGNTSSVIMWNVYDFTIMYGVDNVDADGVIVTDMSGDGLIDKYKKGNELIVNASTNEVRNIRAVSICALIGSNTKLPLIKKDTPQSITDCNGNIKTSADYTQAGKDVSPLLYTYRTTIYLVNTVDASVL
jgi:prepilin-type N-terminal cleavage/methylation domain-containing protein